MDGAESNGDKPIHWKWSWSMGRWPCWWQGICVFEVDDNPVEGGLLQMEGLGWHSGGGGHTFGLGRVLTTLSCSLNMGGHEFQDARQWDKDGAGWNDRKGVDLQ